MFDLKQIRPGVGSPLTVSAAMGLALVLGASAVALSPSAASAIEVAITAVSCSATSACVSGTNSSTGPGVAGTSSHGTGVNGVSTSSYGMYGTSTSGVGVKAVSSSSSAIFASNNSSTYATVNAQQAGSGPALSGTGHAGAGVYGTASSGPGVSGKSSNSNGIGVLGTLDATDAPGPNAAAVSGKAIDNGIGVYAYSQNYEAIKAQSDNDFAFDGNGAGGASVYGSNADGIDAGSGNGSAGYFSNDPGNTFDAVYVQGGSTSAGYNLLNAESSNGSKYVRLDDSGNIHLSGEIYTTGSCLHGCLGTRVRSYAPHESEPTMEDVGSGRLVLGSAYVALDPAFKNVVDANSDYHVLVTPEGDSNGVFVAQRTARGFTVRENRGGRSTLAFSYRIVAKPYGSTAQRLPMEATLQPATRHVFTHHLEHRAGR